MLEIINRTEAQLSIEVGKEDEDEGASKVAET